MIKYICTILLTGAIIVRANGQSVTGTLYTVTIDLNKTAQTIDNFGASGCWFSEGIGKYWPAEKKDRIAELLFSKKFDKSGQPMGIGLSAWRFNIGAGTFEQGDSSGIKDFRKRTECFLSPDGTYDWDKQAGYRFFLQKAHDYGVENLIAFSNSPPVLFTKNGLGFKTEKDFKSNLKENAYDAYTHFLAEVLKHFDKEGLHFNYISPVNEPQWDWSHADKKADQEGSAWQNDEIYHVVNSLNAALDAAQLKSKILVTEAGMLSYLYGGQTKSSHQIQDFFSTASPFYLGGFGHVPKLIGGHSYFTESNDSTLMVTRTRLADTVKKYNIDFWQTEYSMLANGYKDGTTGKRSAMDCALFLAKVIHTDLSTGNATAWQFWNSYEPGSATFDTRYYLIALKAASPEFKDGEFTVTKNLWALGSYSRFVRPGMKRIITGVSNNNGLKNQNLMITAYTGKKNELVMVAINYDTQKATVKLDIKNSGKKYRTVTRYLTADGDDLNMKPLPVQSVDGRLILPARSIMTAVIN
ncbi:MAG TPA: glycoside hydrolase [Mucilaginibacter sp.]